MALEQLSIKILCFLSAAQLFIFVQQVLGSKHQLQNQTVQNNQMAQRILAKY